jgi:hypothetical protein
MIERRLTIRVHVVIDGPHEWSPPNLTAIGILFSAVNIPIAFDLDTAPIMRDPAVSTPDMNSLLLRLNKDAGTPSDRVAHLILGQRDWPPPDGLRAEARGLLADLQTRAVAVVHGARFESDPPEIRLAAIDQTVAHEIGHMLNLGHVEDSQASVAVLMSSGHLRPDPWPDYLELGWNSPSLMSPGPRDNFELPVYPRPEDASIRSLLFPLCVTSRLMLLRYFPDEKALPHNYPFIHFTRSDPELVADIQAPLEELDAHVEVIADHIFVGDPLVLRVELTNRTPREVSIPSSFDPDSSPVEIILMSDAGFRRVLPSRRLCGTRTVALRPGEAAVGFVLRLADTAGLLIDRAGQYYVHVRCRTPPFGARARFSARNSYTNLGESLASAVANRRVSLLRRSRTVLADTHQSSALRACAGVIAARAARSGALIKEIRDTVSRLQPAPLFAKIAAVEALQQSPASPRLSAEAVNWLERYAGDKREDREFQDALARCRTVGRDGRGTDF